MGGEGSGRPEKAPRTKRGRYKRGESTSPKGCSPIIIGSLITLVVVFVGVIQFLRR